MKIPKGFIKESGVYKRGSYIFDGKRIFKESTLLPNEESIDTLTQTKYETLEACIRAVLSYSSDIGETPRIKDIYISKKGDTYSVTEKEDNSVVAIITPQGNVYHLEMTKIPNQDDKEVIDSAEPVTEPKELKEISTEPKDIEDLKENELYYYKQFSDAGEIDYVEFDNKTDAEEYAKKQHDETGNTTAVYNAKNDECLALFEASNDADTPNTDSNIKVNSAYFIRRPQNLEELQDKIDKNLVNLATYTVVDQVKLSQSEFDDYCENLRQDMDFLKSFRPEPMNTDFTCIAVSSESGPTLLIDNSGYNSAQYVSII